MKEHIVRVGPVHAGIIEPGVFRFTCHGERVENLEIELGYQHRGIEQLIVDAADSPLKMICLAEQIAGDTTIAHTMAMVEMLEGDDCPKMIKAERDVALELERIAMNIADVGALSGDVAFQTGLVASEALRTMVINATQRLCGNRFGRTLIRPCGSYYRIDIERKEDITDTLSQVGRRFEALRRSIDRSPSVRARFDEICLIKSPMGRYYGDINNRVMMRFDEVVASIERVNMLLKRLSGWWFEEHSEPRYTINLKPDTRYRSRVAGWRGAVKHSCLTNGAGRIIEYKIEDPSAKLWAVLAEAMKGGDISDFPINNKSFNLSYCGTDK